jgi:hypothetical protein
VIEKKQEHCSNHISVLSLFCVKCSRLPVVAVEADDREAELVEEESERQADVAEMTPTVAVRDSSLWRRVASGVISDFGFERGRMLRVIAGRRDAGAT